jgi:hypothetical protein
MRDVSMANLDLGEGDERGRRDATVLRQLQSSVVIEQPLVRTK